MAWWLYVIGILVLTVAFVLFLLYRGYNKVKPKPIQGIPCPPLSHQILGHPEKMLHPLKHEHRLEVCESARAPIHQLMLMSHASIFINDATEAAAIIDEVKSKGRIYAPFRFDPEVPDLLACDGEAFELRSKKLGPALNAMKINQNDATFAELFNTFNEHVENGKSLELTSLYCYAAFDWVCTAAFGYDLNAIKGSTEGKQLLQSLKTMADVQAGQGIYANPKARKVSPEELTEAKNNWKKFLLKMVDHIKMKASEYEKKNGSLDVERNFGHALVQFSKDDESFGDNEMKSEIHQLLKHGHESISTMLLWLSYVPFKYKQVRKTLESEILKHQEEGGAEGTFPEYLECVLKETLRRFPTMGNMTVRTVGGEDLELITAPFSIPAGSPVHIHMFSIQNSTREWLKPKEFQPERWLTENQTTEEKEEEVEQQNPLGAQRRKPGHAGAPRCPFSKLNSTEFQNSKSVDAQYNGVGFKDSTLCYFPFSAGRRSCVGKNLSLQVMRRFLLELATKVHLDPAEKAWEDDVGFSHNATIVPLFEKTTNVKVLRIKSLKSLVNGVEGALEGNVTKDDEGWADEEEELKE